MKNISIAHIVNPVKVDPASDLFVAQPITFESMRIAKEKTDLRINVQLLAAFFPEDETINPAFLTPTRQLNRSILDFSKNKNQRKLPLLTDILERLYESSTADYLIYTNSDIAVLPFFYNVVTEIIEEGHDAFTINRRTIYSSRVEVKDLPLLYSEIGVPHPGTDCFIFKRSLYPRFCLGRINIGTYFFGLAFLTNLESFANNFKKVEDKHLTFHIGNDQIWKRRPADWSHNLIEIEGVFNMLFKSLDILHRDKLDQYYQNYLRRKDNVGNGQNDDMKFRSSWHQALVKFIKKKIPKRKKIMEIAFFNSVKLLAFIQPIHRTEQYHKEKSSQGRLD